MAEEAGPILVVDDDDDARAGITSLLESAGFSTAEADTGEAALALARTVQPRVALVDVYLPGLSGYEVCHRLKAEYGEALPVVLVSRERREDLDRVAGALLGADDCVTSPVSRDELLALVERLLDRMPDLRPQS
jgi:DNA-binding response OmpR family regulator